MARKKQQKGGRRRNDRRKGGLNGVLFLMMIGILFVVAMPIFVLLSVGLLPSLVAYVIDPTRGKFQGRCVFGLNLSGVAPYAMGLLVGDQSLEAAMAIITDIGALVVMYSCAGLGWLIYLAMPKLLGEYLHMNAQRRMKELREDQQSLLEDWGDDLIRELEK